MPVVFAARHAPTALRPGVCAGRLDLRAALPPECAWRALRAAASPREELCLGSDLGRLAPGRQSWPSLQPGLSARTPNRRALRPSLVWSSPLSRCADLADRAAAALGVPSRRDDRLLEISYGLWEGRAWTEVERDEPQRFRAWVARWETEGCPGGESAREVESRVRSWWEGLPLEGAHLLIGHAGVLRALQVIAGRRSWAEAMAAPIAHLAWMRFCA